MSKVAKYIQGHILGEITTRSDARNRASVDSSVLTKTPEMVAYPRSTNDIRKIAKLAWQLAEKGHALQVHAVGEGKSSTGSSLGSGLKLALSKHLNQVFELDLKQKLIRVQPGASISTVRNTLWVQGLSIPSLVGLDGTVGGAVADDAGGYLSGKYGYSRSWAAQLELVLDSGDVLQTERISKGELNKRKGIQGRIGDIYRGIDRVLEDHDAFIKQINSQDLKDRSGYPGIFDVKQKSGSFDLTPLIVGSQGTLGVVSEMILKAEFMPKDLALGVIVFEDRDEALDAIDALIPQDPSILEYFDGSFIQESINQGKDYKWLGVKSKDAAVLLIVGLDDFNERTRLKKLRKALKTIAKFRQANISSVDDGGQSIAEAILGISSYTALPTDQDDRFGSDIISGCFVPQASFGEFSRSLRELSESLHIDLALHGSALSGIYSIRPTLSMKKVSDKQKIFKIIDGVNSLVESLKGDLVGAGGEGRLLSRFARAGWDAEYEQIVDEIKNVFDPHGIFNPDVKSPVELKDLVKELRSDNSIGL